MDKTAVKNAQGHKPVSDATAPWHGFSVAQVHESLGSTDRGLSTEQANQQRTIFGENAYTVEKSDGCFKRLLAQIHNLLIYVLLAAGAITIIIGHYVDAGVILAVVVLNVTIGLYQEGKAEKSLQAIKKLLAPKTQVWRDGKLQTLPADVLVPGDVLQVASGDHLPADVRWLDVANLNVDESALTGESVPVNKIIEPVQADVSLGDRFSMGYAGTLVTQGQGRAVVVGTGMHTEMGRIGRMIESVTQTQTPFIQNMEQFSRWLTLTILIAAVFLFAYGYWWIQLGGVEIFMAVVGLAVAAIPEGLPAILTITMAIGVQRMAKRQAVVRRLPAVETLGAVTVICSDKTGTLTRNEMTVQGVCLAGETLTVEGVGYEPTGAVLDPSKQALKPLAALTTKVTFSSVALLPIEWLVLISVLCNDASVECGSDAEWTVSGDPTEAALLTLAMKLGLKTKPWQQQLARVACVPFESVHRFMATAHNNPTKERAGDQFLLVKGAPEKLLDLADDQLTQAGLREPLDRDYWLQMIEAQAQMGRRVLAFAIKTGLNGLNQINIGAQVNALTFIGLAGIVDPPRQEAIESVALCQEAGIRVKMITGDHAGTAMAIAKALGLACDGQKALIGLDIETLSAQELESAVQRNDVFARASPEHKIRLVRALQTNGEVVAMTGDGVNDAPALKQADIGIAMGKKGTEAAKQAAEIVLADDNFASIVNAIKEGRTVYDNLKKSIAFLLPINGGESMAITVAILIGVTLPITPLQILWVNMVSAIGLAMVLAFEPAEADIMSRKPRDRDTPLLSSFLIWRIFFVSLLFLMGIFGVFHWTLGQGGSVETARTMAVNALVSMEVFYLFSVRSLKSRAFTWQGVKGTPRVLMAVGLVMVLQLGFTYLPPMQQLFATHRLSFIELLIVAGVGVSVLMVLELEKLVLRWRHIKT
jgi:magnesium-transporting ATPase (P-type)